MGLSLDTADFATMVQQCRQGPAIWLFLSLCRNVLFYPLQYQLLALTGIAAASILVIVGCEESDWIIGKKVKPVKHALDQSMFSSFAVQTMLVWFCMLLTFLASGGNVASIWGGIFIIFSVTESMNILGFPLVLLYQKATGSKKETKTD
mmetsp:Transcript_29548/g.62890  ORF Transcript_29548/g.62890 Transcript_29548/m.62890 type:complete len:149 (+) Transcript_29548:63-509(+)